MPNDVISHVERIVSVTQKDQQQNTDSPDANIASSWSRCLEQYGIDPGQCHQTVVADHNLLLESREKLSEMRDIARLEMSNLYQQIAGSGYAIILTDSEGMIVDNVTDPVRVKEFTRAGLWLGALWSEQQEGTNGIGTCLIEKRPVTVHQDEHFRSNNTDLTCSGAPIFDAHGQMLAVLDASSASSRDSKQSQFHTSALVTLSAKMIENCHFLQQFGNNWVLRFHQRPEFIGMISEGMVAFDGSGKILAVNQSALNQLNCNDRKPLMLHTVSDIFETRLETLLARSSRQPSAVWPVRDRQGRGYFAMLVGPEHQLTIAADPTPQTQAPCLSSASDQLSLTTLSGADTMMAYNVRCAQRLMNKDINILLSGETGTGKEVFAQAVHNASNRANKAFVAINCAAIPENLIESELFGYKEGAFTGARRGGRRGKIAQVGGGTLFLDEIGDMALSLQTRLLRVLEEKMVIPLGSDKPIAVDLHVISASHRNLVELVEKNEFREDLYYRLNGITLTIPALRERTDRAALIRSIVAAESEHGSINIENNAFDVLENYHWPGNIRQLRNVLKTAAALCDGATIRLQDLPPDIVQSHAKNPASAPASAAPERSALAEAEREALCQELERNHWNISATSNQLGISRNTLYRKMKKHGIQPTVHYN